jgi:uncharacterized protein
MKGVKGMWSFMALLLVFMLLGMTPPAAAQSAKTFGLPEMMTWSAYDVGSRGYVQGAAISNALTKKYKTKVRILPSGTSVGRLQPLKTGAATYGLLADEVYFAIEGIYEFANLNWGPQELRVILAHPAPTGMAATIKSGIKTAKDFKGKKIAWVVGASSLNVKTEASLAFAGLTWKDVQKIEVPSYASSMKGLIDGRVDAINAGITAPTLYELENSNMGLYWVEFPAADKEGWKRMNAIAPWLSPGKCDIGPAIKKGQPKELIFFTYPQLVTYAKQDPEEVYALVKAVDETFDMYKDADPEMSEWAVSRSGRTPAGGPFHEAAIRYLKEKGIWTAESDQWNRKFIERAKRLQEAWKATVQEASSKGVAEKDFPEFWLNKRKGVPE